MRTQLTGLENESFSLSWNRFKKGHLCSTESLQICLWDIEKSSAPSLTIKDAHAENINDVRFSLHPADEGNMMISTSDGGHFKIWDVRQAQTMGNKGFVMTYQAGEESLCVGAFNPLIQNLFAVAGDASGNISIFDRRMTNGPIHECVFHTKQVTLLEWCPSSEYMLASGSDDQKVYLWDMNMVGMEQSRGDYEDGPP
jgi:histone-binding protein RBBP4